MSRAEIINIETGLDGGGGPYLANGVLGDSSGTVAGQLAFFYFGNDSNAGETVGQYFNRKVNAGGARTARLSNGVAGIYYRASETNILKNTYLLLHEITHYLYPSTLQNKNVNLDQELVDALGIAQFSDPNKNNLNPVENIEDPSVSVSRYFKNQCDPTYGGPPTP